MIPWIRAATLAVALFASAATAAPAAAAKACPPSAVKVVGEGDEAVVFQRDTALYGCLRASGRTRRLLRDDDPVERVGRVVVAGRYAAGMLLGDRADAGLFYADLSTGDSIARIAENSPAEAGFALDRSGLLVWAFRISEPFFGGGTRTVIQAHDPTGDFILSSRRPVASDLTVDGRRVTWAEGRRRLGVDAPSVEPVQVDVPASIARSATLTVRFRAEAAPDPRGRYLVAAQNLRALDLDDCSGYGESPERLRSRQALVFRLRSQNWCGGALAGDVLFSYGAVALECTAAGLDCFAAVKVASFTVRIRG